jgi:mono/diheme cytochrome c family protein
MLRKTSALAALLFTLFATPSQAVDAARGEKLHNEQCVACHAARFGNNGADIYTRNNRRINDLDGLKRQVNRCKDNLRITWFDEEVADVVEYLRQTYYRFEQ